jgi:hypothetical protein
MVWDESRRARGWAGNMSACSHPQDSSTPGRPFSHMEQTARQNRYFRARWTEFSAHVSAACVESASIL